MYMYMYMYIIFFEISYLQLFEPKIPTPFDIRSSNRALLTILKFNIIKAVVPLKEKHLF